MRPGHVVLFGVDGQYQRLPQHQISGFERPVVDATSVAVVSVRERFVEIPFPIASATPHHDFAAVFIFQCQVIDAVAVAEAGLADVRQLLVSYLAESPRLPWMLRRIHIGSVNEARRQLNAHLISFTRLVPSDRREMLVRPVFVDIRKPSP